MQLEDLIKVGKIVGTHGYKGTVKAIPLTDFPERFQPQKQFIVTRGKEMLELTLQSCGIHRGLLLLKFAEINSLEEADRYKDSFIHVEMKDLFVLPEGHYYQFELLGMDVEDLEKGFLGKLTEILETGANDVYVVQSEQYGEILIPAIDQVIRQVDVRQKRMLVQLLPGLLGEA